MTSSLFIAGFHSQPGRAAAEHVPEQHLWATPAKQSSSHIHTPPDTESTSKNYTLLQKQKENKYTWHSSEMEHLPAALQTEDSGDQCWAFTIPHGKTGRRERIGKRNIDLLTTGLSFDLRVPILSEASQVNGWSVVSCRKRKTTGPKG